MDYLRQDMSDLRRSMESLATELRGEMAALSTDLGAEMAELRATFDRRLTWLVGLMVAGFVVTIETIAAACWGVLQFVR